MLTRGLAGKLVFFTLSLHATLFVTTWAPAQGSAVDIGLKTQQAVASRLKRPSDVGELIHRNRALEAASLSPIYVERNRKRSKLSETETDQSASASPVPESDEDASQYSVETASASHDSQEDRTDVVNEESANSNFAKPYEIDMTLPTPRLDPMLEPTVRFDREESTFHLGEKSKQVSIPSPFLENAKAVQAFKASVVSRQLNFGCATPKMAAQIQTPLDYDSAHFEAQQALELLVQAREELSGITELWKGAEATNRQKEEQVSSLLRDISELKAEVHKQLSEKDKLAVEVQERNSEQASLGDELQQARREHEEAVRQSGALLEEKALVEQQLRETRRLLEATHEADHKDTCESTAALLQRVSELQTMLDVEQEERDSLWKRIGELQQHAMDYEQLRVSQQQQMSALCGALEVSKHEQAALSSKLTAFANKEICLAEQWQSNMQKVKQWHETKVTALRMQLARSVDVSDASRLKICQMERNQQALQDVEGAFEAEKQRMQTEMEDARLAGQRTVNEQTAEIASLRSLVEEGKQQLQSVHEKLANSASERVRMLADVEARLQGEVAKERGRATKLEEDVLHARAEIETLRTGAEASKRQGEEQVQLADGKLKQVSLRLRQEEEKSYGLQQQLDEKELQLAQSRSRKEQLEGDLQNVREELSSAQSKLSCKEAEVAELSDEANKLRGGKESVEKELQECRDRLTGLNEAKQVAEADMGDTRAQIVALQSENDGIKASEQDLMQKNNELEIRVEELMAEGRQWSDRCGQLEAKIREAEEEKSERQGEISGLEERLRSQKAAFEEQERQWKDELQQKQGATSDAEERVRDAEASKEAVTLELSRCKEHAKELDEKCSAVQAHVQELEARCAESDQAARLATRSSSKELNLAQAQASHLRQQVESLTKERDAAQSEKSQTEEELQRMRQEMSEKAAQAETRHQELLSQRPRRSAGAGMEPEQQEPPEQDEMHSVIAQRTRGRINDSARQGRTAAMRAKEPETLQTAHSIGAEQPPGEVPADAQELGEGEMMQSVIAKRTRGRTVGKDHVFCLKHIPVSGAGPPVKIPDTVQLSHTGFVIGRVGSDLVLTSGFVSRKHAQLQRTATGWRVLDTSTNGLCVNGVKVKSQQLADGDILLFEVPQTVGFNQEVPKSWDEKSHFRFRFCVETAD